MTDPNQKVDINVDELREHRDHVHGVVDGIAAAHDASHVTIGHEAFGAFGYFLAAECATAAAEGTAMLGVAHGAADELHQNLGIWAADSEATEGEITELFSNITKDA
jgi:hypothetical protein